MEYMEPTHLKRREICADFQAENTEKVRQDNALKNKKRREAYAKLKFDNNEKFHQQLVLKNKKRREAYATEKISNHLQLKIVQFQNLIRQVLNYEFCPIHQMLLPHSSNLQPLDESKSRVEFLLISRTSNFWHWVCVFYNLQSIFIYDPLNRPDTYDKSIGLLRLLFPKHTGNQKIIHCPYVECDPSKDSALNAISIATSLFYNFKPDKILYKQGLEKHFDHMLENKVIKHFPFEFKKLNDPSIYHFDESLITTGDWLNDDHMYCVNYLVRKFTFYDPVDTVVIQSPEQYKNITVARESKHFQILHGSNHWICYKYENNNISLYDSKFNGNLNELQEKFLRSLHPSCYIEQYNPNVTCPSVQQQLNSDDCGVFAIAFQVSLIFGYDPQTPIL